MDCFEYEDDYQVRNYRRELDLKTAIFQTRYRRVLFIGEKH